MNLRQGIYAAMTAAAVAVPPVMAGQAAPAAAAPLGSPAVATPAPADAAAGLHYRAAIEGMSVVATIDDGSFTADPAAGQVALRDADGVVVDTALLRFAVDEAQYPIDAQISADGRTLRLTPQLPTVSPGRSGIQLVASPLENQLAMNDLINSVSFGLSAGSLIGTIVGAVVGIGAGLAVSGASCVVLSVGCVLAVVPIVTVMGAVGAVAGLILGGGPGLAAGMWNYYTTLNAAPGQSPYASQLPAFRNPAPREEAGK
ncbi:hypothetical protein ACQP0C_13405 [Nocardia sp. CA-129566]|uniref:hypothetical protein n=1 Tax=Nocardia sp. CA-129566 TaxID=3239976 RepID=UPI003D982021